MLFAKGGLLSVVSAICERAGFIAVTEPTIGVIGVIGPKHRIDRKWGAIYDGKYWNIRNTDGLVKITANEFKMWRVNAPSRCSS